MSPRYTFVLGKWLFGLGVVLSLWGLFGFFSSLKPLTAAVFPIFVGFALMLAGGYILYRGVFRSLLFSALAFSALVLAKLALLEPLSYVLYVTTATSGEIPPTAPLGIAVAIAAWLGLFGLAAAGGYLLKKAYLSLSEISNIRRFRTAARLVWIGALTLLFLVGLLFLAAGQILAVLATAALKPKTLST